MVNSNETNPWKTSGIDAGKFSGIGRTGKKEAGYKIEDLRHPDVSNVHEMQEILNILVDPINLKHLAGLSENTSLFEIMSHYSAEHHAERDGRVLIGEDGHVAAVFDISPWDPAKTEVEARENRSWRIKSAFLSRLAVRSDIHDEGIGTKLIEYAEKVAFKEHEFSSLHAGIILDNDQAKAFREKFKGDAQKFAKEYRKTDARGKILLGKRNWEIIGIIKDQGEWGYKEGEYNAVLFIQKTRAAWEDENGIPHRENGASKPN